MCRRNDTSLTWSRLNSLMRSCFTKRCHANTWRGRPSVSDSRSKTLNFQLSAASRHSRSPWSWLDLAASSSTSGPAGRVVATTGAASARPPWLIGMRPGAHAAESSWMLPMTAPGGALFATPHSSPRSTRSDPATSWSCFISSFSVVSSICIRPSSPSTLRRLVTSWCEIMMMGDPVKGSLWRCAHTRQYHTTISPVSMSRLIGRSTSYVAPSSLSASIISSYAPRRSVRSTKRSLKASAGTSAPASWIPRRSRSSIPKMSLWSQMVLPKTATAAGLHVIRCPSKVKKQSGYGDSSRRDVM
mmetsp:Transcript_43512/g.103427  ORF Transcript_43512/g.103427 Transcript_43512/m.103427 type:complete len:301 (-) Transcript_43512:677-1579(-)